MPIMPQLLQDTGWALSCVWPAGLEYELGHALAFTLKRVATVDESWPTRLPWHCRVELACLGVVACVAYTAGKRKRLVEAGVPSTLQHGHGLSRHSRDHLGNETAVQSPSMDTAAVPLEAGSAVAVVIPALVRTPEELCLLSRGVHAVAAQTCLPQLLVITDDGSPVPIKPDDCIAPSGFLDTPATAFGTPGLVVPPVQGTSAESWKQAHHTFMAALAAAEAAGIQTCVKRHARNLGPAAARNTALKYAIQQGADIACMMDVDCIPHLAWVACMVTALTVQPGLAVGRTFASVPQAGVSLYHDLISGTLNPRRYCDGAAPMGQASAEPPTSLQALCGCTSGEILFGTTANMAVSLTCNAAARSIKPAAGKSCGPGDSFPLFDDVVYSTERAFEDVEYCLQARLQGVPIIEVPEAIMLHDYGLTVRCLFSQFYKYGYHELCVTKGHDDYLVDHVWKSRESPNYHPATGAYLLPACSEAAWQSRVSRVVARRAASNPRLGGRYSLPHIGPQSFSGRKAGNMRIPAVRACLG